MCNYIIQNTIFLLFLGIYSILFLRNNLDYWNFMKKFNSQEKKTSWNWIYDTAGWQFFVFSLIFTIVYFFDKKGILNGIFKVFGINICN